MSSVPPSAQFALSPEQEILAVEALIALGLTFTLDTSWITISNLFGCSISEAGALVRNLQDRNIIRREQATELYEDVPGFRWVRVS
jgi:hypothetical protein